MEHLPCRAARTAVSGSEGRAGGVSARAGSPSPSGHGELRQIFAGFAGTQGRVMSRNPWPAGSTVLQAGLLGGFIASLRSRISPTARARAARHVAVRRSRGGTEVLQLSPAPIPYRSQPLPLLGPEEFQASGREWSPSLNPPTAAHPGYPVAVPRGSRRKRAGVLRAGWPFAGSR